MTRRGPVEEQEAGEGGRERETDGRGRTAEDGEADRDDRDRARSEPVLAVEQVHRVQQAEDEDRGRDPFERRAVDADRGDDRDRDLRADAEGDRQGPDVVGETERQREPGTRIHAWPATTGPTAAARNTATPPRYATGTRWVLRSPGRSTILHRNATRIASGATSVATTNATPTTEEAVHTSTSDSRPSCTSTPVAVANPHARYMERAAAVVGGGDHLGGGHAADGERVGARGDECPAEPTPAGVGGDGHGEDLRVREVAGRGGVPQRLDHPRDRGGTRRGSAATPAATPS